MPTERIPFKVIIMPCCHRVLCFVGPRLPNYCPECGKSTAGGTLLPEHIRYSDDEAFIKYREEYKFRRST